MLYTQPKFIAPHNSSSRVFFADLFLFLKPTSISLAQIFSMASISVRGDEVPLVLPVGESGFVKVTSNLLYIRFGLAESSIMVEEEVLEKYGIVKEGILQSRCTEDEGFYWLLHPGQYKAYGLTPQQLAASTEIISPCLRYFHCRVASRTS